MYSAIKLMLLSLIVLCNKYSIGQTIPVLHYTMEDGLPSNTIYSITRDTKGFLWMPTDKGVTRFDGIRFKNYSTFDGLADNEVFNIKEDYNGRLWFATFSGEFCYFKDGNFYSEANTPWLKSKIKSSIFRIFSQRDSSISFILNNYNYFVNIKENQLKTYKTAGRAEDLLYVEKISPSTFQLLYENELVTIDTSGKILDTRAYKINPRYFYAPLLSLDATNHRYLVERKKGIFTMDETLLYPFKETKLTGDLPVATKIHGGNFFLGLINSLRINDTIDVPTGQHVTYIENDVTGNYWFATKGNGLYSISANFKNTKEYRNSYKSQAVYGKIINGKLFFTNDKGDIYRLDGDEINTLFKQFSNVADGNTYFTKGNFLITEKFDFFQFYNTNYIFATGLNNRNITVKAKVSNAWEQTNSEIIKEVFFDKKYLTIVHAHSVYRIEYQDFYSHQTPDRKKLLFMSNRIFSRAMDRQNSLWCSTTEGMYKITDTISRAQQQLKNITYRQFSFFGEYMVGITEKNKLFISSNYEDNTIAIDSIVDNNCIWESIYKIDEQHALITTNNYHRLLSLHSSKNGKPKFTLQTIEDPFVPTRVEYVAADATNCYFFKSGTVTKIATSILFNKTPLPISTFTALKTKRKNHVIAPEITISYDESKSVSITFDNVVFVGKEVSYQYSISEDNTENWTNIEANEINLNTPSFGTYTIKVRAKTLSSGYSKPAVLVLTVLHPFWATWWFITLLILATVFAIWLTIALLSSKKIKKKQREHDADMKFQQSEYKALNALMNPHFIFNSLNNIQGLINKNDKRVANEYLVIFSDLVRQNMHNISKGFITLQEELNLVENYLNLEKLRFKEYINYEIILDEEVETDLIMIPPLMIQPLVENAVKHGLFPKQSLENKVVVNVYEKHNLLHIDIVDNGVGLTYAHKHKSDLHESFGLSNLQKRAEHLEKIQKQQIKLDLQEIIDSKGNITGTKATITMELEYDN